MASFESFEGFGVLNYEIAPQMTSDVLNMGALARLHQFGSQLQQWERTELDTFILTKMWGSSVSMLINQTARGATTTDFIPTGCDTSIRHVTGTVPLQVLIDLMHNPGIIEQPSDSNSRPIIPLDRFPTILKTTLFGGFGESRKLIPTWPATTIVGTARSFHQAGIDAGSPTYEQLKPFAHFLERSNPGDLNPEL